MIKASHALAFLCSLQPIQPITSPHEKIYAAAQFYL
jgi:hypothetical protein